MESQWPSAKGEQDKLCKQSENLMTQLELFLKKGTQQKKVSYIH